MEDGKLMNRYTITHKDGRPIDPNKRYFVLDLSGPDIRERRAIEAFIAECRNTGYEELAADLVSQLSDDRAQKAEAANDA